MILAPIPAASLGLIAAILAIPAVAADDAATRGGKIYGQFCAQCHGAAMAHPLASAFDLRRFPADQHARFVSSVTNGKRAMPAWQGTLSPEQVEDLWAYVSAPPPSAAGS